MAKNPDNKPAASPEPKATTKAQDEFERYKAQRGGPQQPYGFAPIQDQQSLEYPVMLPHHGQAGPGWAFPPSVALLPHPRSGATHASGTETSLADQLGSTLRLGVDAVNAVLVGGIRILTGFSGYGASEYSGGAHECSCGGCCDPCKSECGGYDCCCVFGEQCCRPSVGTCC